MNEIFAYASYLVRFWQEQKGEDAPEPTVLRGEVESIQSGQSWSFEGLDGLVDLLHREAADRAAGAGFDEAGQRPSAAAHKNQGGKR